MTFGVIIEQRAASDITTHAEWIANQGAPINAARWIDGIEAAIQSLRAMPRRFPVAPESETFALEIRHFTFKSHRILYVVQEASVHILHVRHAARLPAVPENPD